ncbi:hypothetical protein TNCT_523991 [Trichonephila clavata]|uniref:Uncharacterized protein n=1 Tax=Trichonephila clavata TaxID=2740835 RepID=A0A8X6LH83_TRICU|nr:hypothetical protein TNCT_523991 [Trichonephila clavata]
MIAASDPALLRHADLPLASRGTSARSGTACPSAETLRCSVRRDVTDQRNEGRGDLNFTARAPRCWEGGQNLIRPYLVCSTRRYVLRRKVELVT